MVLFGEEMKLVLFVDLDKCMRILEIQINDQKTDRITDIMQI